MTLEQIKAALNAGKIVHWSHDGYIVHKAGDQYYITCLSNNNSIGLVWQDGATMNGAEKDFFISNQ